MKKHPEAITHTFDTTAGVPLAVTIEGKPEQLTFVLMEWGDNITCHRLRDTGYVGARRYEQEGDEMYMVRLNYWQGPDYLSLDWGMKSRGDVMRFVNLFSSVRGD